MMRCQTTIVRISFLIAIMISASAAHAGFLMGAYSKLLLPEDEEVYLGNGRYTTFDGETQKDHYKDIPIYIEKTTYESGRVPVLLFIAKTSDGARAITLESGYCFLKDSNNKYRFIPTDVAFDYEDEYDEEVTQVETCTITNTKYIVISHVYKQYKHIIMIEADDSESNYDRVFVGGIQHFIDNGWFLDLSEL